MHDSHRCIGKTKAPCTSRLQVRVTLSIKSAGQHRYTSSTDTAADSYGGCITNHTHSGRFSKAYLLHSSSVAVHADTHTTPHRRGRYCNKVSTVLLGGIHAIRQHSSSTRTRLTGATQQVRAAIAMKPALRHRTTPMFVLIMIQQYRIWVHCSCCRLPMNDFCSPLSLFFSLFFCRSIVHWPAQPLPLSLLDPCFSSAGTAVSSK